jgi:SHAQKYF class myb-like DNA-binding protein
MLTLHTTQSFSSLIPYPLMDFGNTPFVNMAKVVCESDVEGRKKQFQNSSLDSEKRSMNAQKRMQATVADTEEGHDQRSLSEASQNIHLQRSETTDVQDQGRVGFTKEEHRDFVGAIFDIGIKSCSPTVIMEMMRNERELHITRDIMKSHLQKYRKIKQNSKTQFLKDYGSFLRMLESIKNRESGTHGEDHILEEALAGKKVRDVVGGDAVALLTYSVSNDCDVTSLSTLNSDKVEFPDLNETEKNTKLGKSLMCIKGLMVFVRDCIQNSRLELPTNSAKIDQLCSILAENEHGVKRSQHHGTAKPKSNDAYPKLPRRESVQTPCYGSYQQYPQDPTPLNVYSSRSIYFSATAAPAQCPQYQLYQQHYQPVPMVHNTYRNPTYRNPYGTAVTPHYQYHSSQGLPRWQHTHYHMPGNAPRPFATAPSLQSYHQPGQSTSVTRRSTPGHTETQKTNATPSKRENQTMHEKNHSMQSPNRYDYFSNTEYESNNINRDAPLEANPLRSPVGPASRNMFHDDAFEPSHDPRLSRQHPDLSVPHEHRPAKKLKW